MQIQAGVGGVRGDRICSADRLPVEGIGQGTVRQYRRSEGIRRIGRRGGKRHLLAAKRGVPWSLVVTAANRHDVSRLDAVPEAMLVKRPYPARHRSKPRCADAVYACRAVLYTLLALATCRTSRGARRAQSRFQCFHKLLVRYEMLPGSFVALNHLTTTLIAFRKVKMKVTIICG